MKQTTKKRSDKRLPKLAPKSRGLNLSHYRHSGRLLPHSHTSYPTMAMLLLLVGVLLGNMGQVASALTLTGSGSYQVTAAYLGPPPATAATIVAPVDGSHVKATPITVSGSCPTNSYVTLTRNGVTSGTAICGPLNTYSLQTDLFSGDNALQAHVYSKFDVAGPVSTTAIVTYDVPLAITPTPNPTPTPASSTPGTPPTTTGFGTNAPRSTPAVTDTPIAQPLLLKTNFKYVGHALGQPVSYQFEVVGGAAPYAVSINWGDGSTKTLSLTAGGPFSVSHTYDKASQYQNSYRIVASAGDAAGGQTLLQMLAIINDRPTVPLGSATGNGGQPGLGFMQQLHNALKYIWPVYGVTVLMIASFWLGELRELKLLHSKPRGRHHA